MKIGELAKQTGLAASRIRYYESIGLLKTVVRQQNGYREYPDEALLMLNLITCAQQAGFTLDEIKRILPEDLGHWQHEQLLTTLKQKIADIEVMEQRLAITKMHMQALVQRIEQRPEGIDCESNAKSILNRFSPDQLMISADLITTR